MTTDTVESKQIGIRLVPVLAFDHTDGLNTARLCTKAAHTIGVTNGKRGTNSNRIVIKQRN